MAKQMDQDDHYFSAAAQLQKQWKLKVSLQGKCALLHSIRSFFKSAAGISYHIQTCILERASAGSPVSNTYWLIIGRYVAFLHLQCYAAEDGTSLCEEESCMGLNKCPCRQVLQATLRLCMWTSACPEMCMAGRKASRATAASAPARSNRHPTTKTKDLY